MHLDTRTGSACRGISDELVNIFDYYSNTAYLDFR